jgi:type IV pilus biogenesis protein CpaD/CtpE
MVRPLPLLLLLAVAACDQYKEPIAYAPHGAAVRSNMAAMIIDPTPSTEDPGPMDAERALLAFERYQAGEVEALGNVATAPAVVVAPPQ